MTIRCGIRLGVVLALGVSVLVGVGASPGLACSCTDLGPAAMLENVDGAFIGTVTDVGAGADSEGRTRFVVERWLVGHVETDGIDLTPEPCGASVAVGERVAVGIWLDGDGRPVGSDCATFDATLFLDAIGETQPLVTSPGPARYAARSYSGPIWTFDASGVPVSALVVEPGYGLAACDNGLIAVSSRASVQVVDLATTETVAVHPRSINNDLVACGGQIVADIDRTEAGRVLVDRTTGAALVAIGQGQRVHHVVADDAVFVALRTADGPWELQRIDPATRWVQAVPSPFAGSPHRITALAASPDRTRVALAAIDPDQRGSVAVAVLDARSGAALATDTIDVGRGTLRWGDEDHLLLETGGGDNLVLLAEDLSLIRRLVQGRNLTVVSGDTALGVSSWPIPTMVRRRIDDPTATSPTVLPASLSELVDLGGPVDIDDPGTLPLTPPELPLPGIGNADIDPSYLIDAVALAGSTPSFDVGARAGEADLDEDADPAALPMMPPIDPGASNGNAAARVAATAVVTAVAAATVVGLLRRRRRAPAEQ